MRSISRGLERDKKLESRPQEFHSQHRVTGGGRPPRFPQNVARGFPATHALQKMQADLDQWLEEFNWNRPHQGRWRFGKTPMQTFLDAKPIAEEKMIAA
jgi:hypothetical protein